jgi:hypothetical protein
VEDAIRQRKSLVVAAKKSLGDGEKGSGGGTQGA